MTKHSQEYYLSWKDYPADQLNPDGRFKHWPSFSPKEIACRGTGKLLIDIPSMNRLQELRDRIGRPFIINSAYRSPEHNHNVGGAKRSKHLEGKAFDVSMSNHDPLVFYDAAKRAGFSGIGEYAPKNGRYNFMHIDTRDVPAEWSGGGGRFSTRQKNFTPEAPAPRSAEAARDVVIGAGSSLAIESAAREVAPYLPEPWASRAMIFAVILPLAIGAGFAIYRYIGKRSAEVEEK